MAFTAQESVQFSNISATTAQFTLKGGAYAQIAHATGYGTQVQLQALAINGVTWVNAASNITADGYAAIATVPPGQYRYALAGSPSGVYLSLTRIPA